MANYDRHLDFNVNNSSGGVSSGGTTNNDASPTDTTHCIKGDKSSNNQLADSGFDITLYNDDDLLLMDATSPNSPPNSQHQLIPSAPPASSTRSSNGVGGVMGDHLLMDDLMDDEDDMDDDYNPYDPFPKSSNGSAMMMNGEELLKQLDFFDPLAPVQEDQSPPTSPIIAEEERRGGGGGGGGGGGVTGGHPATVSSSSPFKYPSSPCNDDEYEEDERRCQQEEDEDEEEEEDEPHDSLSSSSPPRQHRLQQDEDEDATASLHDDSSSSVVVVAVHPVHRQHPPAAAASTPPHHDSGTECDSLEEAVPPAADAGAAAASAYGHDGHDDDVTDDRTENDDISHSPRPDDDDDDDGIEAEEEAELFLVEETRPSNANETISSRSDVDDDDDRTANRRQQQQQQNHEAELSFDGGETTRPTVNELTSAYNSANNNNNYNYNNRQMMETHQQRSPSEAKLVSTGVSIQALKSTYDHEAPMKEQLGVKEQIETGVSLQKLKSTYLHQSQQQSRNSNGSSSSSDRHHCHDSSETATSMSSNSSYSAEKVVSTGVDIKSLKASYCQVAQIDETLSSSSTTKTHPQPIKIETGVSIKNLKSSFSATNETNNEDVGGVKIDRARITRSFSQVMGKDEKGNLCRICGKPVFLMDRIKAEKGVFHKGCFRCKECSKQLTVELYSSHEGVLYCKPHFKQLFQPKVNFEEEKPVFPRRRHEMIIKENTPLELPPDVVRSSDKPDYGLEELPSLRNIKSRFEGGEEVDGDLERSASQVNVKRSESILNRMAKFQSENGHYEDDDESSSEDEETRDPDVIRESRKKEKLHVHPQGSSSEVSFSGMGDLKSQWENGSDKEKTKEEWKKETQEELNKLRQRICHGKGNMKSMYENAVQESEKTVAKDPSLEILMSKEMNSVKDKWEQGEVLNEVEQEKLEKFNREREEDMSVFKDSGTSSEARTIFKKIDEVVVKTGSTVAAVKKSPSVERSRSTREVPVHYSTQSSTQETEIVRSGERKEEVIIDPTDLHNKFKFFENYTDKQQPERKRFAITPPRETEREDSPDRGVSRDPNVVRACDQEEEIIVTDTAKKMLNKFRELESQSEREEAPPGPKPLKRITPPREFTTYSSDHDSSPEPDRDPNIVRACDKIEDTVLIEAEKTRSLRAKFENWEDNEETENIRNIQEEVQPSLDTAKNLKAKFEALREENAAKPVETPKHKVNRFVDYTTTGIEQCAICGKRVYAMEKVEAVGHKFHKACFKCSQCSCTLRLDNYTTSEGVLYCTTHFKQLFITRGNYDEGFGREQHKEKWNRSRSTTPTPKELNGFNGNGDYSETDEIYA